MCRPNALQYVFRQPLRIWNIGYEVIKCMFDQVFDERFPASNEEHNAALTKNLAVLRASFRGIDWPLGKSS